MNFTLDDSSPKLSYSPDGAWSTQAQVTGDTSLSAFFEGTYHAAQQDGAQVNFSFSGSAMYIYGSKGPGHASCTVKCDNLVSWFPGYAVNTSYQQLLFWHAFESDELHNVSLTVHWPEPDADSRWFDFDFVTFTQGDSASSSSEPSGSATVMPPWLTTGVNKATSSVSLATSPDPPNYTGGPTNISESSAPSTKPAVSTVLAIVFGSLVGLALLLTSLYFLLRRFSAIVRAREHRFRYGLNIAKTADASFADVSGALLERESPARPWTALGTAGTMPSPSASQTTFATVFAGRKHKGDGNSLKTDFLQV